MAEGEKRDLSARRSALRRHAMMISSVVVLAAGGWFFMAVLGLAPALRYNNNVVEMAVVLAVAFSLGLRATTSSSLVRLLRPDPTLEDELVRANRASAARFGFWTFMLGTSAFFVAAIFTPITLAQAAPLLLSAGAGVAGLRFALLEARGA